MVSYLLTIRPFRTSLRKTMEITSIYHFDFTSPVKWKSLRNHFSEVGIPLKKPKKNSASRRFRSSREARWAATTTTLSLARW